jgi:tRNA-guanine transglycosylase (EC 2.4.2.29)
MSPDFNVFQIYCKSATTKARTGVLYLPHGNVCTPAFMPIGTLGTVKSLTMSELLATGTQILLSNTYHLWLKPGLSLLAQFQGLHQFNNWSGPILTDSGGFQIFSLRKNNTTDEQGVTFTVPETGEVRLLTPEISMQIQTIINSDIALVLDSLPPEETNYNLNKEAMERTLRWARDASKNGLNYTKVSGLGQQVIWVLDKIYSLELPKEPGF